MKKKSTPIEKELKIIEKALDGERRYRKSLVVLKNVLESRKTLLNGPRYELFLNSLTNMISISTWLSDNKTNVRYHKDNPQKLDELRTERELVVTQYFMNYVNYKELSDRARSYHYE